LPRRSPTCRRPKDPAGLNCQGRVSNAPTRGAQRQPLSHAGRGKSLPVVSLQHGAGRGRSTGESSKVPFLLLIAATALVFNRPGDWIPALAGWPLFQIVILLCLALSIAPCLAHLSAASATATPVTVCVNGLLVVTFLATLANGSSLDPVSNLAKAWVFYLLAVALVDTPKRLSTFLSATGLSIFLVGLMMVIDHQTGMFGGGSATQTEEGIRMGALGGANFDANDTAALLVLAMLIFFANTIDSKSLFRRCVWIAFAVVTVQAMQLCNSRSSLLALLAGLGTYVGLRWGRRGLKWGLVLLPLFAVLIATDRMTDMGAIQNGTGQSRMQFWSMGLSIFFRNPVLGIGPDAYVNQVGTACHNSFVQAFAELGVGGGAFFVGAFVMGIVSSGRLAKSRGSDQDVEAPQNPHIFLIPALLVAYTTSLLTLNHLFGCHTFLILALGNLSPLIYGGIELQAASERHSSFVTQLASATGAFLLAIYVACMTLVNW
jgi:hypothetical protein